MRCRRKNAVLHCLTSIVTHRKELEAALSEEEAALDEALFYSIQVGIDRAEATATLERVRARCLKLRNALIELDRLELKTAQNSQTAPRFDESGGVFKQFDAAGPPARHSGQRRVHKVAKQGESVSKDSEVIHSFEARKYLLPLDVQSRRLLLKRGMMFLVMVLTYLLYYFVDVQIQILLLPVLITMFVVN